MALAATERTRNTYETTIIPNLTKRAEEGQGGAELLKVYRYTYAYTLYNVILGIPIYHGR